MALTLLRRQQQGFELGLAEIEALDHKLLHPLIHRLRLPDPQALPQPWPQRFGHETQPLQINRDGPGRLCRGRCEQAAEQHLRLLRHRLRPQRLQHLAMQQTHNRQRDHWREGEQRQQLASPRGGGEQEHRQQIFRMGRLRLGSGGKLLGARIDIGR